ncbi:hypothetical protein EI94DRAFT_1723808 [Lactarius quietus]|nr:hypothetical protein EI94DRAFT_1723808 [Lactarius quietus]
MATRFIPTVERESIDLVDRNVAVWNKSLLYVGGFLSRFAYEQELGTIKNLWDGAAPVDGPDGLPDAEFQSWLRARALHALKFFTFHPSTPSPVVSTSMQTAFFTCATTHPFSIISSEGVRSASLVHVPDPEFSGFLKRLPVISEDIASGAKIMIAALRARGMIKNITFVDVLKELRSRPLSETETIACLKWWINVNKQGGDPNLLHGQSQLLDVLVVSINGPPERIMKLSDARTFLNLRAGGAIIPTDGPLPSTLLPTSVTSSFAPYVLWTIFPWKQLTIVDWLRHVTDPEVSAGNAEFDITISASWAERVLSVLARAWPSLPKSAIGDVINILSPIPCVPTSAGLKIPAQAYFASVNMFRDLPTVTMSSGTKGALEKVLQSLGVRKHVELQIVFDRMIETGDWTIVDLVKYLVSVQSTLTPQELEHLRHMSAFPKEGADKELPAPSTDSKVQRYKAMDLYEPVDIFRELGFPIIDWGIDNRWKPSSNEAKFLINLGLRRFPPLWELLNITASDNQTLREKALTFFLDNLSSKYSDYDPNNYRDLAFVPAVRGSEKVLAKPFELYASPEWAALGFLVVDPLLRDDAASKLKLTSHPPTSEIVALLERSPPKDDTTARQWFEVLSGRVPEFSHDELRKLSETPFVPGRSAGGKGVIQRLPPVQCFFFRAGGAELHSNLFSFVDFGWGANAFLAACGTRQEPSVEDIAQILLADPRQFYELVNGRENYLFELRSLAVHSRLLEKGTIIRMKWSNVLLGSRRVKSSDTKASNEGEEDDWDLLQPNKVAIVDDINAYRLFGDRVFCAPQEDILEKLYLFLGSPRLSSLVREDYETTVELSSRIGPDIRHLILERLPLFLHEYPPSRQKNNFIVKVFGKLLVTKSLHHGDVRHSHSHEASAVAKQDGTGPIELWLAGNTQVQMHEVSTSLCRFIFESPKNNDALLFMTILMSEIETLKQLGYNVDRILRQQKAEREEAERAHRVSLISTSETLVQDIPQGGSLQPSKGQGPFRGPNSGGPNVTLLSNISNNIDMAIRACAPKKSNLLRTYEEMQTVPVGETVDEGYCDVFGKAVELNLVGTMSGVKVFAAQDLLEGESLLQRKQDVLARFLLLLNPLVAIYMIPQSGLHVFADNDEQLIAFNRNGSLFLNLRYYEARHDRYVQRGDFSKAHISWYFTLAHEIAHNLVRPHNSEHEIFFTAICEAYLMALSKLLTHP